MEDKTKIDELFKQGLGGFVAEPPVDTWQNIQDSLTAARRRKRVAFWRISGTAAALVLAFFSGYFFNMTTQNMVSDNETLNPTFQFSTQGSAGEWNTEAPKENITNAKNLNEETAIYKSSEPSAKPSRSLNTEDAINPSSNAMAIADGEKRKSSQTKNGLADNSKTTNAPNTDVANPPVKSDALVYVQKNQEDNLPTDDKVIDPLNKDVQTPATEVAQAETKTPDPVDPKNTRNLKVEDEPFVYEDSQNQKKKKRYDTRGAFDLGAVASPTFAFSDVSNQPAQQTAGNANLGTAYTPTKQQSDELQNSYTAGLNFSYRTSPRWEVSTGLHLNNWNQVSSDVFFTADTYTSTTTGGFTARGNTSTGPVTYNTGSNFFDATKFDNAGPNEYYLIPDIHQQYQFLEVPLRVGYYLFDSQKWSFKVQAGFSGRFLTHSDVKLVFEDGSTENYDGLAVKDFSLQLVGGTGLSYKATKNLSINLTPSILYGLTPVNTNSGIETYFHQFLVYTGLTYGF